MDYLSAQRMFVRAVEVGSFSKAAIATNTKTSTVSRAIASLEEDLGVSLFHRTTRRAHLTEPGATFYEHARGVLRGLEEARGAVSAMEGRPQGLIRLHVPSAFARLHMSWLNAKPQPICVDHVGLATQRFTEHDCCGICGTGTASRPIIAREGAV
jgi:DNA-binding transcriptional LysR family regulator